LDEEKERVFRQLQRETFEDERQGQDRATSNAKVVAKQPSNVQHGDPADAGSSSSSSLEHKSKQRFPFSSAELLRRAAFGGTIGSITGAVFGFMDGMRTAAAESQLLQKASQTARVRYVLQGTSRSALLFGGFFGGFQSAKYGIRVALNDPGEAYEILGATAVSMGALLSRPTYRPAAPYAGMLVAMDCVQLYMRTTN
jgi:hypothetical protein